MVSSTSMQPLIWTITLASFIGAVPAVWDPINFCTRRWYGKKLQIPCLPSYTIRKRTISIGIYLCFQGSNIIYLLVFLLFLEHSTTDMYCSIFILLACIYSIIAQWYITLFFEEVTNLLNSFLILDFKIRKYEYENRLHAFKHLDP